MASSSRIKGITIEIDGETTGLQKSLSNVTKESIDIQKELKDVERLLKFDPGNVEALAQKQSLLAKQVENTTQKLNQLKDAESQVEQQFKSGDLGENQYRSFKREIEFTETELSKLKQSLAKVDDGASVQGLKKDFKQVGEEAEKAQESVKDLGGELTNMVAGAAAGMGIGAIVEKSLDVSSLNTQIDISFNVPEESKQSVKDAINTISSYGIDAEEALEGIRRQWALNKYASDESNQAVVQGAGAIASAYSGVDFTELIQETNEIGAGLDISNEAALGLVNSILKAGFPPEQLDTVAEYGQQMKDAGFNAQEIQAIFEKGIDTKTWNIDNLNDGVKEARINMASFGQEVPKSLSTLLSQTDVSAEKMQAWGKAVSEGGENGSKAMGEMAGWLSGIEDKTLQNALATEIFKTKWEDNGTNVLSVLSGLSNATDNTEENMQGLNAVIDSMNSDPANKMAKSIADLITELGPLFEVIANVVGGIAAWIANNPMLAATIATIVATLGILIGLIAGIAPIVTAICASGITAAGVAGAIGTALTALTGPIGIVIAAIVGLVAIFTALYQNNEAFRNNVNETWTQVQSIIRQVIESIKLIISEFVQAFQTIWQAHGNDIMKIANDTWTMISGVIQTAINVIKDVLNAALALIKGDWQGAWESVKQLLADVWNGITALLQNALTLIEDNINLVLGNIISAVGTWCSNMLSSVTSGMNSVKTSISDIWNNVMSFFNGINLFDIGTNIIQGLINGIKSMASGISDTIKNIVDKIPAGVKKLLDIHSPSRVMFGLGEYTGEGFGNGIESTIGNISKQANAMADAAIPNVNAGSYSIGTNVGGGIGSASNLDKILSTMDSMRDEIASLKDALNISIDGRSIVRATAKGMSQELASMSKRSLVSTGNGNFYR